jgi:ubiquinone/menaquinone biosynthesis C-methylase UbiE
MSEDLFEYRGFKIPVHLVEKTGAGTDTFDAISAWHIDVLKSQIGIQPDDAVVEIGCGIGRDAIPLTQILSDKGSYMGTDVIRESITWCQTNITPKHPNFTFIWHDISDDLHNPDGHLHANDVRLRKEDQSTDLIILQSVFTHMFEDEIVHYLKEFRRILKPSGKVWTSVFIVDDTILEQVRIHAPTTYALSFHEAYGDGCFINSKASSRGAVAFTREAIDRMVAASGMELVREPLKGSWSGIWPEPEFGQDVLILKSA